MATKPEVQTLIRYVCKKCQFYTNYVELIDGDRDTNADLLAELTEAQQHDAAHHPGKV